MYGIKRDSITAIKYLLKHFPCVAILGARQVGKTTLVKQTMPGCPFFDLEKQSDFARIKSDPDFFLSQYSQPIVVDEAQLMPELFSALRVAIDNNRNKNGQYLITGYSSPDLTRHINESLAGRIAIFELGGFSLKESWKLPKNNIYALIAEKDTNKLSKIKPRLSNKELLKSCLLGAYPEPFLKYKTNYKAFSIWMENYFQTYIKRDIRNIFPGLNIENYQKFINMLAGASGQILNASEFARSLDVSQPTAKLYFQIAHGTFLWRTIKSYQKNIIKRIVKMPKGHTRDTGLLNYLLRNRTVDEMLTHPIFGRIWETFIIEEIVKGFQNNLIRIEPFYYRTNNQAEIDLIIEGDFGIIPVGIKSGTITTKKQITTLVNFIQEHNLHYGILINNSQETAWLSKKVLQLPAGCL